MSIQLRILQNLLGVLETLTFNSIQFVDTLKMYLDTIWKHLHFVNPALRGTYFITQLLPKNAHFLDDNFCIACVAELPQIKETRSKGTPCISNMF